METAMERGTRRIAGNILIFLPGLILAMSSVLKFTGVPGVVRQMAAMGFSGSRYTLIAVLELLSAALFLYPRTRSFGVLFMSAFFGGVICAHVQTGEVFKAIPPAMLLAFAWAGTWLQHPEMLWSFQKAVPAGGFGTGRPTLRANTQTTSLL